MGFGDRGHLAAVDRNVPLSLAAGCATVPGVGKGSFEGMASDPVATARSNIIWGSMPAANATVSIIDGVRDRAQSEEVTQDAYLDIWRNSSRFDPDRGSALSWLMTIGYRKAVDRVRSAEAARRRDTAYEARDQASPFDQTVEQAHSNLDAQRVRKALDSLTEAQRRALELAYFGGYTHREVAAMLDLPLGTAKTRIRDGLIRLRDTLGLET